MKRWLFLIVMALWGVASQAQNVTFKATAPATVEESDRFQVQFTVNNADASNPDWPDFAGFEVIYGPARSQSSSFQSIKGHMSHSSSVTYTFTLIPGRTGTFTVKPASITVGGKRISSNPVSIHVVPVGQRNAQANNPGHSAGASSTSPEPVKSGGVSNNQLFMTATASRTKVHEQEAVLLTYKLYSLVNLTSLDGKLPTLNGFQVQEVDLPREKQWGIDQYHGRNYRSVVWAQYVLFPQQTGKLVIPAVTYEGVVEEARLDMDPFEAFFNGYGGIIEHKKKIVAPEVAIQVDPLPDKPEDFSGAVGNFGIKSGVSPNEVKTNDAITLKIDITGTGNMKLIKTPQVNFPKDFEVYDPKVEDDFSVTANGYGGTRHFEYLVVPRNPGHFTIPSVSFTFFDTSTNSYRTIHTPEHAVNVVKGAGNASQAISDFTGGQTVKSLNEDIRFIKGGKADSRSAGQHFFGKGSYWLVYGVAILLFFLAYFILWRWAKANADNGVVKGKRANKVARKRLKRAEALLSRGQRSEFYEEVMKALWGYVADKLDIPTEKLSKDNVSAQLAAKGVGQEQADKLLNALQECEFARFAPGDDTAGMDNMYRQAADVIGEMENVIRK